MTPIQQAIAAWFLINGIVVVGAMLMGDWRTKNRQKASQ